MATATSETLGTIKLDLYPRQRMAFKSPATEILFGGASEGGKSYFVRVALIHLCTAVPHLQCFIFRKFYQDCISNHLNGPTGFKALLRPWIEQGLVKIAENEVRFLFNSALISLSQLRVDEDFEKAQGIEKHILVIDEATQIKSRYIKDLRGWVRMPKGMQGKLPQQLEHLFPHIPAQERCNLLPRIIYTANPIGESVGYFRRHFVKARPQFSIERAPDSEGGFLRQYIPSRIEDNPSADPEAQRRRLAGMTDAAIAQALIAGDWDAPLGDFFPEWDENRHMLPDFTPPSHWFRFRSFDWGTAEPFAVYWIAVADGQSFNVGNKSRWVPRGSLVVYREWYGCDPNEPAKGLRYRNEDMADGILQRSLAPEEKKLITVTDSLPFQDRGGQTIAKTFDERGVPLTLGDTSRIPGWSQLRSRLIGVEVDSNNPIKYPTLYVAESCRYARDYIPALPRHPSESKKEDAAEHGEATHSPDAIRLACMCFPLVVDKLEEKPLIISNSMTFDQAIEYNRKLKKRNAEKW